MKTTTQVTVDELHAMIDTYEGLISQCPNGEGADHLFERLDALVAELNGRGDA